MKLSGLHINAVKGQCKCPPFRLQCLLFALKSVFSLVQHGRPIMSCFWSPLVAIGFIFTPERRNHVSGLEKARASVFSRLNFLLRPASHNALPQLSADKVSVFLVDSASTLTSPPSLTHPSSSSHWSAACRVVPPKNKSPPPLLKLFGATLPLLFSVLGTNKPACRAHTL